MTEIRPFPEHEMSEADLLHYAQHRHALSKQRQQMNRALRSVMTPLLRRHGFTGACPHFRRLGTEQFDLLMFLFNKHHASFLIEIGRCSRNWWQRELGDAIPPVPLEKLDPTYLAVPMRALVTATDTPSTPVAFVDCFQYGGAKAPEDYRRIAESVAPFTQRAIKMFDDFEAIPKPKGWPSTIRA